MQGNWRGDIRMGIELLRNHTNQQIQAERRRRLRKAKKENITISLIDAKEIYLPSVSMSHKPRTCGIHKQLTVIRRGTILGTEVAF